MARLVTGEDSPSGRLAETIPEKLEQHPAQLNFPGEAGEVRYEEGFSLDIAGFKNSGTDRVTPSAMAWPALPSSSPICGQKHPRSPPKQGWMRWFSPFRSLSSTLVANAVLRSPSFISGIWSPRWIALPGNYEVSSTWNWAGESVHAEIRVTRRDPSFWDVRTHS